MTSETSQDSFEEFVKKSGAIKDHLYFMITSGLLFSVLARFELAVNLQGFLIFFLGFLAILVLSSIYTFLNKQNLQKLKKIIYLKIFSYLVLLILSFFLVDQHIEFLVYASFLLIPFLMYGEVGYLWDHFIRQTISQKQIRNLNVAFLLITMLNFAFSYIFITRYAVYFENQSLITYTFLYLMGGNFILALLFQGVIYLRRIKNYNSGLPSKLGLETDLTLKNFYIKIIFPLIVIDFIVFLILVSPYISLPYSNKFSVFFWDPIIVKICCVIIFSYYLFKVLRKKKPITSGKSSLLTTSRNSRAN